MASSASARPRRDAPTGRSRAAISSAPQRPSSLRLWLRRRRGMLRPAGLGLLGTGALAAAALAVLAADPVGRLAALWDGAAEIAAVGGLQVQEVTVEGLHNTPPELVREALGVRRGDPILGFDPQEAKLRLELIAWVGQAHVERLLPGTIKVRLEERQPFAIWQRDSKFAVIDRDGKVVATDNIGAFGRLPLVVGPGADRAAAPMVDALRSAPEVQERVHALVRVSERRWNLRLRNGADVLLPENQEAAAITRLAELHRTQALLDRPLAAIDLRLPDKLVLRLPAGQQPAEPQAQPGQKPAQRSGRG
ncbi:cell division protein FtsQ/DivIB [Paracraurococcus lichenis]|uniref:Cell division protein FtsQ n=1 Tax=Paracraurococcus lichenis TaxID=3064888 RepID=A0ABT9E537_9PROT|nr:cell division protein FtsQ/DivIB [Paracraurococcus sp. LOR1-02]MDO9711256.1 cell division protein FtsQ/DivIB [Paracraurococcus sp. LOR1-02]